MPTLDLFVGHELQDELATPPRGRFRVVHSGHDVLVALESRGLKTWITSSLDDVSAGLKSFVADGAQHTANVSDFWYLPTQRSETGPAAQAMDELWLIQRFFEPHFVLVPPSAARLPLDDFVDAVLEGEPQRSNVVVAGVVQCDILTLWRADGRILDAPLSLFQPAGDGTTPDFTQFAIKDCGLTLKFGAYESTVDVVLFQLDPEYRRRVKLNERQQDPSFGASLRRLRLLRRLKQTDFAPAISEREIRRIEANEVAQVHQETQDALARRLKVTFSDIASY